MNIRKASTDIIWRKPIELEHCNPSQVRYSSIPLVVPDRFWLMPMTDEGLGRLSVASDDLEPRESVPDTKIERKSIKSASG